LTIKLTLAQQSDFHLRYRAKSQLELVSFVLPPACLYPSTCEW